MKKHLLSSIILFAATILLCHAQNPILWGVNPVGGGVGNDGSIFRADTSGITTDEHNFGYGSDGRNPLGSLIKATNGLLYGLTENGGANAMGAIFSYNIQTGTDSVLYSFAGGTSDGRLPTGTLIQASDSLLYGTTQFGGARDSGMIFSYNITTGKETDVHDFGTVTDDGYFPTGTLVEVNNSVLYGTTQYGGANGVNGYGVIYSYTISTHTYAFIYSFSPDSGYNPSGGLIQANNGLLYGMTYGGGAHSVGTIYSFDIKTNTAVDVHDFVWVIDSDGWQPIANLFQASNGLLYGMTPVGGSGYGAIFSFNDTTNQETVLHNFGKGTDGKTPYGDLIQASNGLLYGTTETGGKNTDGTIFSFNLATDSETDIHDFSSASGGYNPEGDLLEVDSSGTTGVTQLSVNSNQLSIYPNPSSDFIHTSIQLNQPSDLQLRLVNMLGQTVWSTDAGNVSTYQNNISVANLPDGVYLLEMITGSGTQSREVVVTK